MDAGLTQSELAKRLGLEYYTFISQIETGLSRVPPELLEQYAHALGVDATELARNPVAFYDPHMHAVLFPGTAAK